MQTALLIWQAAGTVDTVNVKVGDNIPDDFVMAFLEKSSLPQSVIMAEADLADAQKTLDDLLTSDTARAGAVIALREAEETFVKAENYLHYLQNSRRIPQTSVRTFLIRTRRGYEYRTKTKTFKGPAPEDWIIEAENDLALRKPNGTKHSAPMIASHVEIQPRSRRQNPAWKQRSPQSTWLA